MLFSFFAFLLWGTASFSAALAFDAAMSNRMVMDVTFAVLRPPCIGVSNVWGPGNIVRPFIPLHGAQA